MGFEMQVDFHPAATIEVSESTNWYSKHSPTAARNFLVAIDVAIATIVDDPERFAYVDERHQACSVTKFPYQIVFRRTLGRIEVIAVVHARRRPGYWRDR